ncbi:hypothetical protein BMF94_5691 [Rhodotorula taiwanensis]|uniref:Type 2A phosphatase activator TIP41 n=1 Tax=Rhodotorula taiwanensis TaxID=741276 RepID=A0A2S5B3M3_9BASI|nr:hypothetical protein BMF94_5691 [Rhodotorula taiwanensis]
MPRHRLHDDPSRGQRQIALEGWTISSTKRPILSIPEADAASTDLDLALPEICFGNNALRIEHDQARFALEWNTLDMLRAVQKGQGWDAAAGSGAVRVAYADEWTRAQAASGSLGNMTVQKPFDWTYTTLHPGSTHTPPSAQPAEWRAAPPTHPGIPLASLARTDIPILFFDEIPLFEDELGDNGIANVTVRVRVNRESFFVLSRFALRIDNLLFRYYDVRTYHAFGSGEIIREIKGREAPYELLRNRLRGPGAAGRSPLPQSTACASPVPSRAGYSAAPSSTGLSSLRSGGALNGALPSEPSEDLTPLTDSNWVAGVLEELALADEMQHGLNLERTGQQSHASQGWEGKGRKLEILSLPQEV